MFLRPLTVEEIKERTDSVNKKIPAVEHDEKKPESEV